MEIEREQRAADNQNYPGFTVVHGKWEKGVFRVGEQSREKSIVVTLGVLSRR
jgi:hypothetical protein